MKIFYSLTILLLLLFTACTQEQNSKIIISTNPWIGYTPLYYAEKKGYLKDINMQLITNVSLAESTALYDVGKVDMITATQHEYYSLRETEHNIVPIILLDRSNGGDMILSNKTIPEIQKAKKIYAYLEIDSINAEVLEDFMHYYKLDKDKIEFINKDQAQMLDLQNNPKHTLLIVSYSPYDITLKKHGFHTVASTKDMRSIIVIDALFTDKKILQTEKKRLRKLKKIIDRSIQEIQADTKGSFIIVKAFLGDIGYNDYLESLKLIKWINNPSEKLLKRIKPMGFDKNILIQ